MSELNQLDKDSSTATKLAGLDDDTSASERLDDTSDSTGDLLADDKIADESTESGEVSDDNPDGGDESPEDTEQGIELSEDDLDPNAIDLQVPVRMKEVLKKYPDLKKDFPELIASNYREKEYAELLPTIEDAKLAIERSNTLGKFEEVLITNGDSGSILNIVKEQNPDAFSKIVNSYLPTLEKIDPQAYHHVVATNFHQIVNRVFAQAQAANNEDLQNAARMMYQWAFGNSTPAANYGKPVNEAESAAIKAANETKTKAENSMLEFHRTQAERLVGNTIKHTINNNIDPKGVMTPYIKRKAVDDCYALVESSMKADKKFNAIIEGYWGKAKKSDFSKNDIDSIIRANKGMAKSVLKEAIIKTRGEVLKGISQKSTSDAPKKFKVQDTAPAKQQSRTKADDRGKTTFQRLSEP